MLWKKESSPMGIHSNSHPSPLLYFYLLLPPLDYFFFLLLFLLFWTMKHSNFKFQKKEKKFLPPPLFFLILCTPFLIFFVVFLPPFFLSLDLYIYLDLRGHEHLFSELFKKKKKGCPLYSFPLPFPLCFSLTGSFYLDQMKPMENTFFKF